MILDRQNEFHSLGRLAEILQTAPSEIRRAAEAAEIPVALLLDGRPYYADGHLPQLRRLIRHPQTQTEKTR